MTQENCYSLVEPRGDLEFSNMQTLKRDLERGTDEIKYDALKKIIMGSLNGQKFDALFMLIIRFVMPTKNKKLKKLLLFYWEVCPKYDENGKLKQEAILICNALLNDINHPNEYIRGATLRFLCHIKDQELLEPLLGPVRECLEHRHAYVRRNAVLAIHSIYKNHSHLIPDSPDLILSFLVAEPDVMCKRNALVMLTDTSPNTAINWLMDSIYLVEGFESSLKLAVIDLIRKAVKTNPKDKPKFIRVVFELLSSESSSVKFEAADTLVTLTNNAAAIKAAGMSLIQLISKESDNNIKLIVLEKLDILRRKYEGLLDDLVMDLLQALVNSDLEVKRKCLSIVMELTIQRNVDEVIGSLKAELKKTFDTDFEKAADYRVLLVQTIHSCAVSFPEVASGVVKLFLSSISEFSKSSAADAISFVREVVEKFPLLRFEIMKELLDTFPEIKSSDAMQQALWILGEYSTDIQTIRLTFERIFDAVGELPILAQEEREAAESLSGNTEEENVSNVTHASSARRILPDGTYATESSLISSKPSAKPNLSNKPPIRALLFEGQYYVGTVLSNTLVKLVLRFKQLNGPEAELNELNAKALLIMIGVIRVGQSSFVSISIDEDSYDRILACIRALEYRDEDISDLSEVFLDESHSAFSRLVNQRREIEAKSKNYSKKESIGSFDSPIEFRLLAQKHDGFADDDGDFTNNNTSDVSTGGNIVTKLDNIVQMTGFSDPVYAEAYLIMHQYDITLDILVVNQTSHTLRDVSIDFSMLGDLKLVEKPRPYNMSPRSFSSIKAAIKVSSAETGVIFGSLSYEGPGVSESHNIIFNDINIDIMEYIRPSYCDDTKFFSMWSEFEWENKINVTTKITDLRVYLDKLLESTNMACLTPESALMGDCGFLSANLYAKSIFGEDALMNISLEKVDDESTVTGHIRIRSKSQGIALSLGDKITAFQTAASAPKVEQLTSEEVAVN
ncbi:hypothetical protein BB559_001831 [Furculomyces boomerangus]|uniref:Coatomer subunit beta n=2 Tax=Harpellales TaxID=61421 RepID=A0A2T9Z081_9FUNG|nr:hypothetical protein BB559_001831 [Furculomyces boomerangus]PWA03797.1 hypothetical protein BB558_000059 [Smittium angustum]